VLSWDIKAQTSPHNPVSICEPDLSGDEIKKQYWSLLDEVAKMIPLWQD